MPGKRRASRPGSGDEQTGSLALPSKTGADRVLCAAQSPLQWTKFAVRMKVPAIRRCFATLFGVWVLVACALPPLWRMNCTMTGRAVVEWFTPRACMLGTGTTSEAAQLQATCCSYTHASAELSPTAQKGDGPGTVSVPAVIQHAVLASACLASITTVVQRPTAHAPPLGRVLSRLALSGQFRL